MKPKVIGGTFTLTCGSVTSEPIRFNAGRIVLMREARRLEAENAAVWALRNKRKKSGQQRKK